MFLLFYFWIRFFLVSGFCSGLGIHPGHGLGLGLGLFVLVHDLDHDDHDYDFDYDHSINHDLRGP